MQIRPLLLSVIALLAGGAISAQPRTDSFLLSLFKKNASPAFQRVLKDPAYYRLQIIYTRIDRDRHNHPSFTNYYFNYDPDLYFNPASTVKLPLAFLSLEKLHKMGVPRVTMTTPMQFDSSHEGQKALYADSTAAHRLPSISHFIRKALLVSDNDAYNRMYQFLGQQTINRELHAKGYPDIRITRQFMGLTMDQNRHTNAIRFIDRRGHLIYLQPPAYNEDSFFFPHPVKLGKGYLDRNDSLVNEPIDFTFANNLSVRDLQQLLQSVLFPSSVPAAQQFGLSARDKHFLYRYLSQFPSETNYPKYDTGKFFNSYVKFFFRDGSRQLPQGIRVFNKVGWAYGFLTDVSYVADFKNRVEYMITATIYVNSDGILNDDKYDYNTVGYPFLYQLGQTIYRYECARPRAFRPRLSKFREGYERRREDGRPVVTSVDN
jgi:Beta-lactamase enzyme family